MYGCEGKLRIESKTKKYACSILHLLQEHKTFTLLQPGKNYFEIIFSGFEDFRKKKALLENFWGEILDVKTTPGCNGLQWVESMLCREGFAL